MPAKPFPWLSEVERTVRRKCDQPFDEPGQPTWALEEWWQAFNDAHRHVWERISSMDRNFGIIVADVAVATGSTTTGLPSDLRALRKLYEVGSDNVERASIRVATFDELAGWCANQAAVYRPTENDLYWARPTTRAFTMRVIYSAYPPRLPHGCIQKLTTGTNIQLAPYESDDDAEYVDLDQLLIYQGTGCGTTLTPSAYDGCTKTLTVAPAVSVDDTSGYTSRPALPVDAYDAFVYDVCARLTEKLQDERWTEFVVQRDKQLRAMHTALHSLDRQEPLLTRDDAELGGHNDPFYEWY